MRRWMVIGSIAFFGLLVFGHLTQAQAFLGLGFGDSVEALASWDDGHGAALYAGGSFTVSPAGDSYLAKWGCRPNPPVKRRKL